MKKTVLTFGIIAGLICGAMFFIFAPGEGESYDFENGQLYGYITMAIALSSIFFAVKQYRDKHLGGSIKFGKAFLIGLYITGVAGVVYVASWELYSLTMSNDFADQYMAYMKTQLAEEGMSEAEIEKEVASQQEMMDLYKNNIPFRLAISFTEILPVGLLISLISALIFGVFLKPRPPATATA